MTACAAHAAHRAQGARQLARTFRAIGKAGAVRNRGVDAIAFAPRLGAALRPCSNADSAASAASGKAGSAQALEAAAADADEVRRMTFSPSIFERCARAHACPPSGMLLRYAKGDSQRSRFCRLGGPGCAEPAAVDSTTLRQCRRCRPTITILAGSPDAWCGALLSLSRAVQLRSSRWAGQALTSASRWSQAHRYSTRLEPGESAGTNDLWTSPRVESRCARRDRRLRRGFRCRGARVHAAN